MNRTEGKMSFEQAMEALQQVLTEMETGTLTLDESVAAYEEAVSIIKICREKLEGCQRRIEVLRSGQEGAEAKQIKDEFAIN